jgi:hypothetical protein
MSEWWTYRLTSFLLFSPRTYRRLFELYNVAIWPAQIAGVASGLAVIALMIGTFRHRDRVISGLLAMCWLWVAWGFLYQRYAQINWAATWFAAAFVFQALLFIMLGVFAHRILFAFAGGRRFWIASAIAGIVVVGYPLLAPLTGRSWTTAETFGVTPDPTALATAALLCLVNGRIRWPMLVVPLLWCAITGATLWAMNEPEAIVVATLAVAALLLAARVRRHTT